MQNAFQYSSDMNFKGTSLYFYALCNEKEKFKSYVLFPEKEKSEHIAKDSSHHGLYHFIHFAQQKKNNSLKIVTENRVLIDRTFVDKNKKMVRVFLSFCF